MIHYLVTREHAYTMRTFLETWQRDAIGRVSFEYYDELPYWRHVAGGTFIFSDLERLRDEELQLAQSYAQQLGAEGARILNEPRNVLRRYDLLKLLHEKGINPFRAYRINEARNEIRFPVFVREENEHTGSLSELVQNEEQLANSIADLTIAGHDARNLLIVEYCHTGDASGVFRKFATMKVGDRLIPRHVLFSSEWVDKHPDVVDMQKVGEEAAYLKLNPHQAELLRIFELAKIDYGRVDYSVRDGKVVVWEINTNPVIAVMPGKCDPERLPGQARSARAIAAALDAVDSPTNGHVVEFQWDRELMRRVGIGALEEWSARVKCGVKKWVGK